jgi:propionyl-CoA carboxylase alpha chain
MIGLHAGVAALAAAAAHRRDAKVLGSVPSGWRNVPTTGQAASFACGGATLDVVYDVGRPVPEVSVDGIPLAVTRAYEITPDLVDIAIDHVRIRHRVEIVGEEVFVDSPAGTSRFTAVERFQIPGATGAATSPVAPTPGKVVAVLIAEGDEVFEGDALVVIESMKMEQAIRAPSSGVVRAIHYVVGDQVDAGAILVEIEDETDG